MTLRERPAGASTRIGVTEIRGILGTAVAELGRRVVSGTWPVGEAIPKEADLTVELGVSRSVIREAVRVLSAKGMLRSRTSDGTRVLSRHEWRLLDPDVVDWRIRAGDTESLLRDLLELRLVLEPGVVYRATLHRSDEQRERIRVAWQGKVVAKRDAGDPDSGHSPLESRARFIAADLAFHREFMSALDSELLMQLFGIVEAALEILLDLQMKARGYVVEMIGMEEGHRLHLDVFEAYERGDAPAAEAAMRTLLESAVRDAEAGFELLARERRKAKRKR